MDMKRITLTGLSLIMLLSACKADIQTEEPTPVPTTEAPIADTDTPSPTVDTTPAIFEGDLSDLLQVADLGPRREFEHGGFALDLPQGFLSLYRPATIILGQEEEGMILSAGGGLEVEPISYTAGLERFLLAMTSDISDLTTEEYETVFVDGQEGLAADFQGTLNGRQVSGRLLYLNTSDMQFLVVMGFSWTDSWETTGSQAYEAMVESIELFPPTPMLNLCPVSADPTFGFTQENPIRVGQGDPLTGPRMEQDYLNLLRGPNGENVTYVRRGSLPTDETILDEYELTYGDPPTTIILYLDQYHDAQFRIPRGFSCGN
jgi:hypothetical protein